MKTAIEGYRLAYKQVYKLKEAMQERVEKKKRKVGKAYFICKGFSVYNEKDLLDIYQSGYLQSYEYDKYLNKLEKLQKAEKEGVKRKEEYALEG